MRIKPVMIPNTGIEWPEQQNMQNELDRLETKYGRALNKKEMADELHISVRQLERRMISCKDVPNYVGLSTGANIFPITEVAKFFTERQILTDNYSEEIFDD